VHATRSSLKPCTQSKRMPVRARMETFSSVRPRTGCCGTPRMLAAACAPSHHVLEMEVAEDGVVGSVFRREPGAVVGFDLDRVPPDVAHRDVPAVDVLHYPAPGGIRLEPDADIRPLIDTVTASTLRMPPDISLPMTMPPSSRTGPALQW
jgi:hypothetical protein